MAKYTTETDHLFQWSQGYRLQVPKAYKDCVTQFYSEDYPNGLAVAPESYEKEGGKILCPLPNQLTVNTNSIIVYAYRLETGKAYTESKTVLSVWARPKPEDYVFVPTDVVTYQTAIELIADMREALVEEGLRVEAETLRAEAEALRVESEASRVSAEELRTDAEELRESAEASRSLNEADREEAEESRAEAESSRVSAEASRTRTWTNATATATDGDTPKASVTVGANGVEFDFTLVRGLKGDTGNDGYTPVKNVDYFDGYTPQKNVDYFDGEKGDKGDTGNGIANITLVSGTHAAGTVDTYRIVMTDGATFDFTVYNGANGEGAGDMVWNEWLNTYDPQGIGQDFYAYADSHGFSGNYNDLTNKPTIPSKLSQLTADSTHRVVTDAEKTTWNNKSDFSGSYNDLTDKPEDLKFNFTITHDYDDDSGDTMVVPDRTIADMRSAYENGREVIGVYNRTQYRLAYFSATWSVLHFTAVYSNSFIRTIILNTVTEEVYGVGTYYNVRIPAKTSQLTNDSGYITSSEVPSDVFVATYGTTTSADIYNAVNSGKAVFVRDGQTYAPLNKRFSTTWFDFVCVEYTSANSRYGTPSYTYATRYEVKNNVWTKDTDVGAMPCSQPTSIEYTMLASGWSNGEYSFEAEYGVAYNIDIEPSSACTEEQLSAWSEAKMCAVFDSNVVKAMGTVPTIDIPIILTYTILV